MNEISNSNKWEEFEILDDQDINLNLIKVKQYNNTKNNINNIQTKKEDDKIYEEDYEIKMKENLNPKFIINNQITEDNNIIKETNVSETFKRIMENKEEKNKQEEIFDFEKIELNEEEKGDFTEISISSLSSKKSKSKEDQIKDQKNLLFNLYQELNFGNGNNNNKTVIKYKQNESYKNNKENLSKTCINLGRSDNNRFNIVKLMSVLKSIKMNSWKDNFKSLMSSLFYNGYALSKKFDKSDPDIPLYIFDNKIESVVIAEIGFLLKTFLYFSYRSGLVNLNSIGGGDFTSDCGWGCMLRCCQMMLSKGIIKRKMNDYSKNKNYSINFKTLENIRKETLYLFTDNYLQLKEIKNHPDYQRYWELYKNLSKTNSEYKSISEVIPPYSIHILCILGKISGEYTSDLRIIKLFIKINSQLFPNFNMLLFECGLISKKKLISSFCEEYIETNKSKLNYLDTITYNGVDYIFKKEGIVFISFRFGLNELDSNYYDIIPLFFTRFRNNLGFVSGKKNKAYYFVGIDSNKKLIFLDPHYNQELNNNFEMDYESYFTENIYLLDIKDLSSELTLGIGIFNSTQFLQFLDDINWFNDNLKEKGVITLSKD